MTKPMTIPKALPQDSALSYDFLCEEGIQHIQRMAGDMDRPRYVPFRLM